MAKASIAVRTWLRWPALVLLGATLAVVILQGRLGADDSPRMWDFEDPSQADGWNALNADLDITEGRGVDGSRALSATLTSNTLGQVVHFVDVEAGHAYTLGGTWTSVDGDVTWVRLHLVVYDENLDPLNPELLAFQIYAPGSGAGSMEIPCELGSAQIRLYIDGDEDAVVYLDNIFLKDNGPSAACPPTPTATATITPSPTPSPSPTSTATPTPTDPPAPTPTPTWTATGTSSPTDTAEEPPTATNTPSEPTATDSPDVEVSLDFANDGFEAGVDAVPDAWQNVGGVLSRVGSPKRSGSWAGALFSSTSSTKWAYQAVAVQPASWYEFHAFVLQNDPWVESALLRVSWYASSDGTGTTITSVDSTEELTSAEPSFRRLTTGPVMAPPGARSARVRVLLRPIENTNAVIYIDDASFAKADPPAPPTDTPTFLPPTPTPTAVPTSTPTDTPEPPAAVATATPTDTPRPTDTPSPAATTTAVPDATATDIPTSTPESASGVSTTLANASFEEASSGVPDAWHTFGGLLMQTDTPVRSGAGSGAFFSTSDSTKWLYQTVAVEPTSWYQFDAFVYHNHAYIDGALLRVSWYASPNGTGSALTSVDSIDALLAPLPRYRSLTTGAVQAPPGAHSARPRILMRPSDSRSALIYIDDASFSRVAEPQLEHEPGEPDAASSATTASGRTSQVLSTSSSGSASSTNGTARSDERPGPMPAPVIRRNSLQSPDQLATPTEGDPLWPWVVLGAIVGAGAVGWGAFWAIRRHQRPAQASATSPDP